MPLIKIQEKQGKIESKRIKIDIESCNFMSIANLHRFFLSLFAFERSVRRKSWKMSDETKQFYFRGAGLTNFVVGFEKNGSNKYVWRFRCPDDEKAETVDLSNRQILPNYNYLKYTIAPLFTLNITEGMKLVEISAKFVQKIAFDLPELGEKLKLFLHCQRISVLEMPDYASLFLFQQNLKQNNVFCVELKPKQGHVTGLEQFKPYCTNCLLNILKCSVEKKFQKMYDYCPLRLFSGDFNEMKLAFTSLIKNPHNNLRIYKNGQRIFSKETLLSENDLAKVLSFNSIDIFIELIIKILLSSPEEKIVDKHKKNLPTDCVLGQLLKAQKLDSCGPFVASDLAAKYPNSYIINPVTQKYDIYDEKTNNPADCEFEQHLLRVCLTTKPFHSKFSHLMQTFCSAIYFKLCRSPKHKMKIFYVNFTTFLLP